MTSKRSIGLIGAGLMGHGIASNLLKHGHALAVLEHPGNQPLDALRAAGATTRSSAKALAHEADVVILCVTGSPQVEAVLLGAEGVLGGLRRGTVVIDCSTAMPDLDRPHGAGGARRRRPLSRRTDDAHAQGGRRGPAQPAGGRRCGAVGRVPAVAGVLCREHHPRGAGRRRAPHEAAAQLRVARLHRAAVRGRRVRAARRRGTGCVRRGAGQGRRRQRGAGAPEALPAARAMRRRCASRWPTRRRTWATTRPWRTTPARWPRSPTRCCSTYAQGLADGGPQAQAIELSSLLAARTPAR